MIDELNILLLPMCGKKVWLRQILYSVIFFCLDEPPPTLEKFCPESKFEGRHACMLLREVNKKSLVVPKKKRSLSGSGCSSRWLLIGGVGACHERVRVHTRLDRSLSLTYRRHFTRTRTVDWDEMLARGHNTHTRGRRYIVVADDDCRLDLRFENSAPHPSAIS